MPQNEEGDLRTQTGLRPRLGHGPTLIMTAPLVTVLSSEHQGLAIATLGPFTQRRAAFVRQVDVARLLGFRPSNEPVPARAS